MARRTQRLVTQDSLSNLAASLGQGKDKAAQDAFFVASLSREQIEAMYRGDWLARKIVDIVPYDSIRAWRAWSGEGAAIAAIERQERRLGLAKAVQRAMILGRLYGGGAIVIGTDESDAAHLAAPLYPEAIGPGGIRFLHVVSRWQLSVTDIPRDPLDAFFGEPSSYRLSAPDRGELVLHPSRVVRFFGNPLPDPLLYGAQLWSDSVLQSLYDAIHAVAVTGAGATSLMHEAKVDIVTVPGLSEHLSNASTTAQLSQRFAYAAAMKSINNLLLLGDGETWARQSVNFSGLPEMVRTFLQVAAGAADIPVTRLLGQSPAGLSATGDSDTRNYYDMIAARQELDLRPQLERLDALLLPAAGVDPGAVRFAFRPLWQLSAAEKAQVALQKAQTSAVYAGLNLWPAATTAQLVRSQLVEDGVYPGAGAVFGAAETLATPSATTYPEWAQSEVADFSPDQPRDDHGRWTAGAGGYAQAEPENGTTKNGAQNGDAPAPRASATSTNMASIATNLESIGTALSEREAGHEPDVGPHAPDGTPLELTSFRGKGRAGAIVALLGVAARIARWLSRGAEIEEAEPPLEPTPQPGESAEPTKASPEHPDPAHKPTSAPVPRSEPALPDTPPDRTPDAVLRGFAGPKSMRTWQNQMIKRDWTASQIEEAIQGGERSPAENRVNPGNGATRYIHPKTGRSIVIDDTTGQVIQLGGEGFGHER